MEASQRGLCTVTRHGSSASSSKCKQTNDTFLRHRGWKQLSIRRLHNVVTGDHRLIIVNFRLFLNEYSPYVFQLIINYCSVKFLKRRWSLERLIETFVPLHFAREATWTIGGRSREDKGRTRSLHDREKSFSPTRSICSDLKQNTRLECLEYEDKRKLREREGKKFLVYDEILVPLEIRNKIGARCKSGSIVPEIVSWIFNGAHGESIEETGASLLRGEERYRVRWGTVHRTTFRVGLAISRDTVRGQTRFVPDIGGPCCFPARVNIGERFRDNGRWYRWYRATVLGEMSLLRFGPFKDGMCPFWFASLFSSHTSQIDPSFLFQILLLLFLFSR